jgi:hypothetical protein
VKKNGFTPVLVLVIIALILGIIALVYYSGITINIQQPKDASLLNKTANPTSSLVPTSTSVDNTNYEVVVKTSADSPCNTDINLDHCKSDIYLKDLATGKETFVITLDDVEHDTRVPPYRLGYLYLIKRTGNDTYPSNDWTDELWVYDTNHKGVKVYDSKGLYFDVNQDGSLIAVLTGNSTSSVSLLSKDNSWQSKIYSIDFKQCNFPADTPSEAFLLDLEKWQQNPSALWGAYSSEYGVIGCYWKLNPNSSNIVYYPVPPTYRSLFAFNTDKLVSVYTDKPPIVDVDTENDWQSTHTSYSLYVYSLQSQKSTKIDTFPSNYSFNATSASWVTSDQLRYSSPKGEVTYTLPGQ